MSALSDSLRSLERALKAFWDKQPNQENRGRACVSNLIFVCKKGELGELERLRSQMGLAARSRSFALWLDSALPPWEISGEVDTHCVASAGGPVCAEHVKLALGAATAKRVTSLIIPLLVAEAPTYLVSPFGAAGPLMSGADSLAGRLVYDSRVRSLAKVRGLVEGNRGRDLNWQRLMPWRRAIADSFDSHPQRLGQLRSLRVTCGSNENAGRLLWGWLSSRLASAGLGGGAGLELRLEPGDEPKAPALSRVVLGFEGGERERSFDAQSGRVVCAKSPPGQDGHAVEQPPLADSIEALLRCENEPFYEAALALAAEHEQNS